MEIEEGNNIVEQLVTAKAQGEAPAPQNAGGPTTQIQAMQQFPTQFAQ